MLFRSRALKPIRQTLETMNQELSVLRLMLQELNAHIGCPDELVQKNEIVDLRDIPSVIDEVETEGYQITEMELTNEEIKKQLEKYETKYGMTSEEFYRLWRKGDRPDTKDTFEWAMFYEITQDGKLE